MVNVKLKFKPSSQMDKEGTLYYQITTNSFTERIKSRHKIYNNEWDIRKSKISIDNTSNSRLLDITNIKDKIKIDFKYIENLITPYINQNTLSVHEIIAFYLKQKEEKNSFTSFVEQIIAKCREQGKSRTAETYISMLSSFITFLKGRDVLLNMLDCELLEDYEAFLKHKELSLNTISFYMRKLRAIYNRAVEKEIIIHKYPFKRVYTSIEKTPKRAIPLKVITKLKTANLSHKPKLDTVRDLFLFSFYTRGMSFIDLAYLRKTDLKNSILTYKRRKTNQKLQIKWEKCMEEIVQKYSNNTTEYLLPIILDSTKCHRLQYMSKLAYTNKLLKKLAVEIKIDSNLTMYVARHSWASAAKIKNIPISIICESMGHDSESTTQIYLATLESTVIDKANKLIITSV